ncbi:MAG: chemotaxis protein CheA [Syntrophales bacterium]|nr:chemotaxis protein CheA [Syntrophales bacterium]MDD5642729.1 chemotaxis protein CheA [Syntrophales bacterium]
MKDKNQEAYREEAQELLAELEESLLALEQSPEDDGLIGRVFRALHTIKGSGAMFGFEDIASFTHEVETVFDLVRDGKMAVTRELVDLSLAARDEIRAMLDGSGPEEAPTKQEIIAALRALLPQAAIEAGFVLPPPPPQDNSGAGAAVTYRIRFRPAADIFLTGATPLHLLNELRQLGDFNVVAQTEAIPLLADINPEHCHTSWDIFLTTSRGFDAIADVFIFVADDSELDIQVIDDGSEAGGDYKRLGEILVERGDLDVDSLNRLLAQRQLIGEALIGTGLVGGDQVHSALVEQRHVRAAQKKRLETEASASIRVPSAKLDQLVDLVGELVTVQARLSQTAINFQDPQLLAIAEEVERLTGDLRDNALNIRMLPIGTIFSKFQRLVRDLAAELGRDVDLITAGAETELDKTVLERLNDPLVHLLRNSIDHGIEPPEARLQAGKPKRGRISLTASHSGAQVLIRVHDDGGGLDREAIRAKAVDLGCLAPDVEIPDKELFSLIMSPGFSTAKEITNVSGRGVGMDVVKKAIEALRGTIEIDSQKGAGTTITIKLPLTLAIIEGLLVTIENDYFVVPLSVVTECVELTRADVARANGHKIARVRNEIVPYIHLRERFDIEGHPPAIEQIVITEMNGSRVGLVVDQVIGEQQTVIKSLSRVYRSVAGISGATLLGDGTVALILDAPQLVQGQAAELAN